RLTAEQFDQRRHEVDDLVILDVRNESETMTGRVPGAHVVPLPRLLTELPSLDLSRPTVVYCAGGYRSSIAASVLRSAGGVDVSDVVGGYDAWAQGHDDRALV